MCVLCTLPLAACGENLDSGIVSRYECSSVTAEMEVYLKDDASLESYYCVTAVLKSDFKTYNCKKLTDLLTNTAFAEARYSDNPGLYAFEGCSVLTYKNEKYITFPMNYVGALIRGDSDRSEPRGKLETYSYFLLYRLEDTIITNPATDLLNYVGLVKV